MSAEQIAMHLRITHFYTLDNDPYPNVALHLARSDKIVMPTSDIACREINIVQVLVHPKSLSCKLLTLLMEYPSSVYHHKLINRL